MKSREAPWGDAIADAGWVLRFVDEHGFAAGHSVDVHGDGGQVSGRRDERHLELEVAAYLLGAYAIRIVGGRGFHLEVFTTVNDVACHRVRERGQGEQRDQPECRSH